MLRIERPDAPQHYMVLREVNKRVFVRLVGGETLADSTGATRLLEVGKSLYNPVLYFPRSDILVDLKKQERQTYCPLKGDASYFSYESKNGLLEDLAWSYEAPFEFSGAIAGLVAFYSNKVIVEEHPL